MKSRNLKIGLLLISLLLPLMLSGCNERVDAAGEAPPPANVVPAADPTLFTVDHPDQFPLVAAAARPTTSELVVTASVTPDVSRNVPVGSLASGRVVAIHARLGDTVKKGQLMLRSEEHTSELQSLRHLV